MNLFKKLLKGLVVLAVAFIFVLALNQEPVYAKVKYKTVKRDYSKTYQNGEFAINTECLLDYVQLKGSSTAIKKINKQIKALAKAYKPLVNELVEDYQDEITWNEDLYDNCSIGVNYQDKKFINIYRSEQYYGGGVVNTFYSGYVYSLKTGKPVPITKVTGMSLKKIKKNLIKQIKASGEFDDEFSEKIYEPQINGMKAEDFSYFINGDNSVTVTFEPYALGWGGWFREYTIKY